MTLNSMLATRDEIQANPHAPLARDVSQLPALRHFAYIDAVRGLAFLAVLTLHTSLSVGYFPHKDMFEAGSYGVQFFFLASAVTLCYSMKSRSKVEKFPLLNFYLRRVFRIAPLFWIAIAFYWAFPDVMPRFWLAQWAGPSGVRPRDYLRTSLFLHGWYPYSFNSIVPGGWSIAVEMTFYLIFPFLFRVLNSVKKAAAAVLCSWVLEFVAIEKAMPQLHHWFYPDVTEKTWSFFTQLWFPVQLPVFLTGIAVYWVLAHGAVKPFINSRFWCRFLFCASILILLSLTNYGTSGLVPTYLLVVTALAGIFIAMSGIGLAFIVNPVICYLGTISYSCYLTHFAVLGIILKIMSGGRIDAINPCINTGHSVGNLWLFIKIFTLSLAVTALVSTVTLHVVENPGIAAGRKFIRLIVRSTNHGDLSSR